MGAFLRLLVLFRLWYTVDMVTLSIPQGLIKDGFVVLPRREYEDLLRAKQVNDIVVKRDKSFKVPKKHEKFYASFGINFFLEFKNLIPSSYVLKISETLSSLISRNYSVNSLSKSS